MHDHGFDCMFDRCLTVHLAPKVDFLAELMGLKKVGWIFAQSNKPRDYIISGAEVQQMAAVQVRRVW